MSVVEQRAYRYIARTRSHDLPISPLQLLEDVVGTDLPFPLKIRVIDSVGVNDFQRLRGPVYGALIVDVKADLLEGDQPIS
jgi:hypothetical protein